MKKDNLKQNLLLIVSLKESIFHILCLPKVHIVIKWINVKRLSNYQVYYKKLSSYSYRKVYLLLFSGLLSKIGGSWEEFLKVLKITAKKFSTLLTHSCN